MPYHGEPFKCMLVNMDLIIASGLAAFMDLILLAFPKLGVLNTGFFLKALRRVNCFKNLHTYVCSVHLQNIIRLNWVYLNLDASIGVDNR